MGKGREGKGREGQRKKNKSPVGRGNGRFSAFVVDRPGIRGILTRRQWTTSQALSGHASQAQGGIAQLFFLSVSLVA